MLRVRVDGANLQHTQLLLSWLKPIYFAEKCRGCQLSDTSVLMTYLRVGLEETPPISTKLPLSDSEDPLPIPGLRCERRVYKKNVKVFLLYCIKFLAFIYVPL